jgi:predicted alpha/beta superfamily hydrolase
METHTLHIDLTTPAQDDRPIYLTGNFCNWAANLPAFQLEKIADNRYVIDLTVANTWPDPIEYKYNRGGEGSFELNEVGEEIANRTVTRNAILQEDYVPFWQHDGAASRSHWVPAYVELPFEYPDKDEPRRVRVLLPADYEASQKRYPVLYLNDGQNAIGAGDGFGSWQVEARMAMLASRSHHELIIVAIDHGGETRITEYVVGKALNEQGSGEQYITFLTDTVKPHIDATYRTRPQARYTGIGGSSMGGLISVFGGLLRPEVFGRWLVFSPSLWISPTIYDLAAAAQLPPHIKVYLYGGEAESGAMVSDIRRLHDALRYSEGGISLVEVAVDPDGKHEEWRWSREFVRAVDYLFFNYLEPTPDEVNNTVEVVGEGVISD